jgi:hypothetical protein
LNTRYFALIAAVGWFIISIILLTLPGTAFPQEDWLSKIWADKWIHIGMFALMVVLWCSAWHSLQPGRKKDITATANYGERSRKQSRVFMIIALVFLCYGIAMEFIQLYFVANRSFDVGDIAADAIGCVAGVVFSTRRYIKK